MSENNTLIYNVLYFKSGIFASMSFFFSSCLIIFYEKVNTDSASTAPLYSIQRPKCLVFKFKDLVTQQNVTLHVVSSCKKA